MRRRDSFSGDLFSVPCAASSLPGAMDYRVQVASLVAGMLKATPVDRYDVAAQVTRLTGKELSKAMLDGYTAESRDTFNLPLWRVPALEVATQSYALSQWLADKRGGQLLIGRDALNAELGRLERQRDDAAVRIRLLKDQLRGGR